MMYFCLLIPSLISILIINRREKLTTKDLVLKYPFYLMINNLITLVVVYIYSKRAPINIVESFNMLGFTVKYLLISTAISYVIPYIVEFIRKNLTINLDYRKKGKKHEK